MRGRPPAKRESKRERFVRVAEQRTQKVLDALHSLGNCSAKESYSYTDKDVEQILSAIEKELQSVRDKFAGVRQFSLSNPFPEDSRENMPPAEPPTFVLCLAATKEEYENGTPSEAYELNTLEDCLTECAWRRAGKVSRSEQPYFAAYVVAEDGSHPWFQIFDTQHPKDSLDSRINSAASRAGAAHADTEPKEHERAKDYFL